MSAAGWNADPVDADALLAELAAWWQDPEPDHYSRNIPARIAGGKWDQEVPVGTRNPYWEIIRQLPLSDIPFPRETRPEPMTHLFTGTPGNDLRVFADRFSLCRTFSWSIPSPGDIAWMRDILGGKGVVETGAGSGYWAWQMEQAGIDAVAYDPAETGNNKFACRQWATVLRDDHGAARLHPDRALFLCWPSYAEPWAAQSLACYDGDLLIFAGEPEGGCTADDEFFKLLDAEWEESGVAPQHVSHWGIHCYLTACMRKGAAS